VKLFDKSDNLITETTTDIQGRFIFRKIREIPEKLKVLKEGYKEKEINLSEFPKTKIGDMIIRLDATDSFFLQTVNPVVVRIFYPHTKSVKNSIIFINPAVFISVIM